MEGIVGEGNLLACIVEWGGSNVGPGRAGARLGGRLHGRRARRDAHRARARGWRRRSEPIGPTRVTDNVRGMIWTKLLVNSTFTGLSAVSGLRYGGVAEQGPDAVFALWAEGVRSATRRAWSSSACTTSTRTSSTPNGLARMMEHMANVRPSMLQDLDAGRETEVDVVNGGVARKGRELGIPTPCNDAVVELVHSMERGERAPDPRWLRLRQRRADDQRDRQLNPGASPRRRGAASGSKQWSASLPGISMSRMRKPTACTTTPTRPKTRRRRGRPSPRR